MKNSLGVLKGKKRNGVLLKERNRVKGKHFKGENNFIWL